MTDPRPSPPPRPRAPVAGGALLALSIFVGTAAGVVFRQVSIGFLVGLAAGVAISLAIWAIDRRRD